MAEIVRRRSFGAVLPLGRHISISGSRPIQCASDSIVLSSFQEKQNARHYKQFKFEQALGLHRSVPRRVPRITPENGSYRDLFRGVRASLGGGAFSLPVVHAAIAAFISSQGQ